MKAFILFLFSVTILTSCRFLGGERIRGNGNIVNVQRNVGSFNSIEASGAVEVRIKQDAATMVRIETDENLVEFLDVFTDGSTLVIRPKKGYSPDPSKGLIVYASAPQFRNLEISGASKIISAGTLTGNELEVGASGASEIDLEVKVSRLEADLSGASKLMLAGSAERFRTEASGSSNIKCMDLVTDEATLQVSGASDAEVNVNKQLNIDASGSSDVKYKGNADVNQKSSGASSVQKI